MDEARVVGLARDVIEEIRAAAKALSVDRRRRFQAEVADRYCGGNAGRVERMFGGDETPSTPG